MSDANGDVNTYAGVQGQLNKIAKGFTESSEFSPPQRVRKFTIVDGTNPGFKAKVMAGTKMDYLAPNVPFGSRSK